MDRGPFRGDRPAERRPASTAQIHTSSDELQPAMTPIADTRTAGPVTYQSARQEVAAERPKPKRKLSMLISGIVVLLVLIVGGWFGWHYLAGSTPPIDTSKYQAVFFTTGQVYFGKLSNINTDYMQLTGVFYAQTNTKTSSDATTEQPTDSNDIQLIPLGEASYGPENKITIAKGQVMFYENLKSDSQAAKLIQQYLQSH